MKTKKILLLLGIVSLSMVSCNDFLDENKNPNKVDSDLVTPQAYLPGAQTNIFRTQATTMNALGNIMTNAWGSNIYQFTGGNSTEYSFNFNTTTYSAIWNNYYLGINNFQKIIETTYPNQGNYIAIAKILKAHYMQYIVDFYGDAPYFEAWKGQANLAPAYTDDAVIYKELVKELEEARALIDTPSADAEAVTTDVMFAGDMAKWKQFANTIELRILLRQSELTDAATISYLNTKYADLQALSDFVTADVLVNPGYSSANDSKQNPFYNTYIRNSANATTQAYNSTTSSKFFADVLNGDAAGPTAGVVDGRRNRFFILVSGKVVGVEQGLTASAGQTNTTNPTSRIGPGVSGHVAVPPLSAVQAGSAKAGVVMLLSESLFLQSEAVQRGKLAGDARDLFNQGIQASFTYLAATPATAGATYITNIDSKAGFGWTASADKIQAIMTQKWIALNEIHGGENYINYTRTGYPVIPNPISALVYPSRPKRLLYPSSEYSTNPAHVPDLGSADVITQGPFWYVP
ncbi:MAG: SusD/RagB family nutrient-binding outer membrane lipoprotein [Bacteroidota bacterium]